MKILLTFLCATFLSLKISATAQFPDKIFYQNTEYALFTNPLESYFNQYPDRRPKAAIISTALWRGYVATFEIKDNQLLLKDIEIQVSDTTKQDSFTTKWKSVLTAVFPNETQTKINWLTGLLVIPYGKLINYVHGSYASTYENYILIEINKGDLIKEKKFDYKEYANFKVRQFQVFKGTKEYEQAKEKLQKDGIRKKYIDNFLINSITDYTSKMLTE